MLASRLLPVRALLFLLALASATDDHQIHARSWKTLPQKGDMPATDLQNYWAGLEFLKKAPSVGAFPGMTTFPVNESLDNIVVNKSLVPNELQGIWLLKNHPTFGHAIFSFIGGDKAFDGNAGLDPPGGYVKASFSMPGGSAFIDNPGNLSKFMWFHNHSLEFSFSKFNHSLKPGDSSDLNVYLDAWYRKFPIPAAILEGWTSWEQAKWILDPKRKTDPAFCFCSAIYDGPDEITRNNFGKFAYKFLRLADGRGVPTRHWEDFKAVMAASGITHLAKPSTSAAAASEHMIGYV